MPHPGMKRLVETADGPSGDAFGRWRVSNPTTLYDGKQLFDNLPLFWDEALESGSGITSAHSVNRASTILTSTSGQAGVFTRQTFMRFNYSSGKSQLTFMTGVLRKSGGGAGVQRRAGIFDDANGVFWEDDEGTAKVVLRSNVTGTPVDTKVAQADWNVDQLDGTGVSGVVLDLAQSQVFFMDFEWLGVGRSRLGIVVKGRMHVAHQFLNANAIPSVYMSTPNLPLRYQMVTTNSPASSMEAICATVISEGGEPNLGSVRYISTEGTHVDADVQDTIYAIIGIRLKATHLAATIKILSASIAEHQGGNNYEWLLIFNPAVAGTFTYSDVANSAVQVARGATANTVTNGTQVGGGHSSSARQGGPQTSAEVDNARRLGASIAGVPDTLVLCVRPIGGSTLLDIEGGIAYREAS